jgi:hypothetical protein
MTTSKEVDQIVQDILADMPLKKTTTAEASNGSHIKDSIEGFSGALGVAG